MVSVGGDGAGGRDPFLGSGKLVEFFVQRVQRGFVFCFVEAAGKVWQQQG